MIQAEKDAREAVEHCGCLGDDPGCDCAVRIPLLQVIDGLRLDLQRAGVIPYPFCAPEDASYPQAEDVLRWRRSWP
jgi:hypothetical protein